MKDAELMLDYPYLFHAFPCQLFTTFHDSHEEKRHKLYQTNLKFTLKMGNSQDKLTSEQRHLWETSKQEKAQLIQQIESLKRDLTRKESQAKGLVTKEECRAWINEVTQDLPDITKRDKKFLNQKLECAGQQKTIFNYKSQVKH